MGEIVYQHMNMMLKNKNIIILLIISFFLCSNITKSDLMKNSRYLDSYLIYLKGDALFKKNKFSDSIYYYKKAIKKYKEYPEPYYKLAKIYYLKKDYNAMNKYISDAYIYQYFFRNNKDLIEYYYLASKYYEDMLKFKKALDRYLKLNTLINNRDAVIIYKIGYLNCKIKNYNSGEKYLEMFLNNSKSIKKSYREELKTTYQLLINIYMDKKEYKKSLTSLRKMYIFFPGKDIYNKISILSNNLKYSSEK